MMLSTTDWVIVILYLIGMILLSIFLSRGQKNQKDYYLGGNSTGAFPVAISIMATQCSTNSILGAPAFVAFSLGGGLLWLQYELAVPFAMIFLMIFLLPLFKRLNIISVYAYLEKRFGKETRTVLSIFFQFFRAFSAGVTVYGICIVIEYCTGISFFWSVAVLGIVTVIYDSIGGMKAVIYSDVIQMVILYAAILFAIYISLDIIGGYDAAMSAFDSKRLQAIDFSHTGFDGKDFAFWPMLIGGFFLYVAYYGTDQTQVQRQLSTKDSKGTNMSLFLNGMLRFPLVLTYCFLGICIGAYAVTNPDFLSELPLKANEEPNYNLAVPIFVMQKFPIGFIGLFMVGLFSAAMSSLDSIINSLSATTMQDIVKGYFNKSMNTKKEFYLSKVFTVFWGLAISAFAFFVGGISDSIIVSINKISSLANGPILGVFVMGILIKRINNVGAIIGLLMGFATNILLWVFVPNVSWLWWNVTGCISAILFGYLGSLINPKPIQEKVKGLVHEGKITEAFNLSGYWGKYYLTLAVYGIVMLIFLGAF